MPVIKYCRKYEDLTNDELRSVIKLWKPAFDLTPLKNKDTLKLKATEVLSSELSFDMSNNPTIYFEACDRTRATTCKKQAEIDVLEYQRDRPRNWNFAGEEFHPSAFEQTVVPY